jgi:hypothetical protein
MKPLHLCHDFFYTALDRKVSPMKHINFGIRDIVQLAIGSLGKNAALNQKIIRVLAGAYRRIVTIVAKAIQ